MSVKARVSANVKNTKAMKMQKKKTQPVVEVYQSESDSDENDVPSHEQSKEEEDEVEEDDGFNAEEEADEEEEEEEDDQSSEDSDDDEPEDDDHDGEDSVDGDDEAQADDEDGDGPQSGWADAMAKVLNTGKTKEASSLFLSKARMDSEWKRKAAATDDKDKDKDKDSGEPEQKKTRPPSALAKRMQRKEIESKCRVKPPSAAEPGSAEARMAEKQLSRLATRGVVQFFNAVRDHQKTLKTELSAVGGSVRKREKVMRQMADREGFMETLEKSDKRQSRGAPPPRSDEVKQEQEESSWNILREDFMMGAKMRDWDKESDGE